MIFYDEFIENLPGDNWEAIKAIKSCFEGWDEKISGEGEVKKYVDYLEAYAFLNAFLRIWILKKNYRK